MIDSLMSFLLGNDIVILISITKMICLFELRLNNLSFPMNGAPIFCWHANKDFR